MSLPPSQHQVVSAMARVQAVPKRSCTAVRLERKCDALLNRRTRVADFERACVQPLHAHLRSGINPLLAKLN